MNFRLQCFDEANHHLEILGVYNTDCNDLAAQRQMGTFMPPDRMVALLRPVPL